MTKTSVFIVRAEFKRAPESYIMGVYPTEELTLARIDSLEDEGYDTVWYDEVKVGAAGADCDLSNR